MEDLTRALRPLVDVLERHGLMLLRRGSMPTGVVRQLTADSRRVRPLGLFVAVRGHRADGHDFLAEALRRGARAVVAEQVPEDLVSTYPQVSFIQVRNSRQALALLAAAYYGYPAQHLRVIGVTGTNGKTTTTFLIHHLLSADQKVGLVGTVHYLLGGQRFPALHTTPDPLTLHRTLRMMGDVGCTACVMEVSSHALDQDRVYGIPFDVAVFTNLTRDHLDYHGTMEGYARAKKRLFDELPSTSAALYNADDPHGREMVRDTRGHIYSYGLEQPADFRAEILENSLEGLKLRIEGQEARFPLIGRFNAYNLLAAYAVGRVRGMAPEVVVERLQQAPPVPGRFERIPLPGGPMVIVDYAHTPDALKHVLETLHDLGVPRERIWCVFGCGGDRDQAKRPMMGAVAEALAGNVVVTSDNPRTEDPLAIIDMILEGMERPDRALVQPDRREAIRQALLRAAPGDVVLVAGKGHENYQIVGTERIPFDDREVVREIWKQRRVEVN